MFYVEPPAERYTDEDFWNQDPNLDIEGVYDINTTPYERGEDGDWHRIHNDDD